MRLAESLQCATGERFVGQARDRSIDRGALVSVAVAGVLCFVGLVRVFSYTQGLLGGWIEGTPLEWIAYRADGHRNVRYFKILATPSFVSLVYFAFRIMNRGQRQLVTPGLSAAHRDVDFRSPWVRLGIVAAISAQWAILESYKFLTHGLPYSPLESWRWNAGVLLASAAIAFVGMRFLSFRPLVRPPPR
jgi:hypothetical protein